MAWIVCFYAVSPASSATAGRWTIMRSPYVPALGSLLRGVSCTERDWCMAVGFSIVTRHAKPGGEILTETWNGTGWSVVPGPRSGNNAFMYLNAVSCVSRTWCMAVGEYISGGRAGNLAELWNGSSWSHVLTPGRPGGGQLNWVSCVTANFCMAVGDGNGTLAETWNGSAWKAISSPHAGKQPALDQAVGVSCPSQGFCMLLDLFDSGANQAAATFSWNGSSWSALPTPNPGPATNALRGVDCTSAVSCIAVGNEVLSRTDVALTEHWNGASWSVTPTPAESSAENLTGVSCTGPQWCAAVGERIATVGARTVHALAEVSQDGTWLFTRTGNPSPVQSVLSGVSCGGSNTGGNTAWP